MAMKGTFRAAARRVAAGMAALLASAGLTVASGATADAATTCHAVSAKVSGGWVIQGRLCAPTGASTVLLLQSGATYGSQYWDFGYQPETYSFVDYASAHGLATLNIDRLGIGNSSHPPAEAITTESEAGIAHQLIQGLRSGEFGQRFAHVGLAGHSLGSVISVAEAGTYHDVDALVLTGLTHSVGTAFVTDFEAALRPAALVDPRRFGELPLGYLTTVPGGNEPSYYKPNADPAVMAYDEAHKQTMTDGEDLTIPTGVLDTLGITAPVLSMVGQYDVEFCGPVRDCSNPLSLMSLEPTFYPAAKSFQLKVVPDAAHNLNLQRNAQTTFGDITSWVAGHAGG
jgi:hypothetical protein